MYYYAYLEIFQDCSESDPLDKLIIFYYALDLVISFNTLQNTQFVIFLMSKVDTEYLKERDKKGRKNDKKR